MQKWTLLWFLVSTPLRDKDRFMGQYQVLDEN